jgi:hypothetical protein
MIARWPTPPARIVVAPPVEQRAPVWDEPRYEGGSASEVWLLGAHGGAGVSSLARAWDFAGDCERRWPAAGQAVLIVARAGVAGLAAADALLRQHCVGLAGECRLAGMVVVAARPGRTPTPVRRDLALYGALAPRVWRVPWHEQLLTSPVDRASPPASLNALGREIRTAVEKLQHSSKGELQ